LKIASSISADSTYFFSLPDAIMKIFGDILNINGRIAKKTLPVGIIQQ